MQQAEWTRNLRSYLFEKVCVKNQSHILEVGCGTGAVIEKSILPPACNIYGLDIDSNHLREAIAILSEVHLTQGDAHFLPFPDGIFDIVYCHYFLMWLEDPLISVQEMVRVIHPGGWVIIFAEPDYGGRIDFPDDFTLLGDLQIQALQNQGADPFMGRKIRMLLNQSGLLDVEIGIIGAEWKTNDLPRNIDYEWDVLKSDIQELIPSTTLLDLESSSRSVSTQRSRILYVPTFFGFGRVPEKVGE